MAVTRWTPSPPEEFRQGPRQDLRPWHRPPGVDEVHDLGVAVQRDE
ncbi:hypothetical protein [Streptomyces sp. NPDC054765]